MKPKFTTTTIKVAFDTEYTSRTSLDNLLHIDTATHRIMISGQFKLGSEGPSSFFLYPDYFESLDASKRLDPTFNKDNPYVFIDFFEHLGYAPKTRPARIGETAKLVVELGMFFGVADFTGLSCNLKELKFLEELLQTKRVEHSKYLKVTSQNPYIETSHYLTLTTPDGVLEGVLNIALKDISAILGSMSYKKLLNIVGLSVVDKGLMDKYKTCMDTGYETLPIVFKQYALGDVLIYNIDEKKTALDNALADNLNLDHPKQKATVGSMVQQFIQGRFEQIFIGHTKTTSQGGKLKAQGIATHGSVKSLLRVNPHPFTSGGRAFNAAPLPLVRNGIFVDLDIGGAYAGAMREVILPVGVPWLYQRMVQGGSKLTLRAFMKKVAKESSKYNAWYCTVSTSSPLSFKQYIFNSNTQWIGTEVNLVAGYKRVLSREIYDGVITPDLWELFNVLRKKNEIGEFLDNCEIGFYMLYKDCDHVSVEEFNNIQKTEFSEIQNEKHPSKWTSITPGTLGSDIFRAERVKWKKGTPQNEQLKLYSNTSYGDLISRFFSTTNLLAGNHITGRVRTIGICMELGLRSIGTITDGGEFDINTVVHPSNKGREIPWASVVESHNHTVRENSHILHLTLKPLLHCEVVDLNEDGLQMSDGTVLKEYKQVIDNKVKEHLLKLFPTVKSLAGTTWEMKDIHISTTRHGTSSYRFGNWDGSDIVKARSYKTGNTVKCRHVTVNLAGDVVYEGDSTINPMALHMRNLHTNPRAVPFPKIAIQGSILKTKDYVKTYRFLKTLSPGDTFYKVVCPKPFSLSLFTFETYEQEKMWVKADEKLRFNTGFGFEQYFIDSKKDVFNIEQYSIVTHKHITNGENPPKEWCYSKTTVYDKRVLTFKNRLDLVRATIRSKLFKDVVLPANLINYDLETFSD